MKIPEWNDYYPSLCSANKEQKEFYRKLEKALENNSKIDIGNNLSYVFVYLYEIIKIFIKKRDINSLIDKFEIIKNFYGNNEAISSAICNWLKDAYLSNEDYENAWETLKHCKFASIEDIIYIRGNCKDTFIESDLLIKILGSEIGLTTFGKENIKEVRQLVDIFLNDFYFQKKLNYAEYFLNSFDYGNLNENDYEDLKNYYPNEADFLLWKNDYVKTQKSHHPYPKKYHHYLFSGAPIETPFFERTAIPYIVSVALTNEFKRIIRNSENAVRIERNLPRVGEGWINETNLFYKISNHYIYEKVVHHGKPHWLNRQHLDIYFPDKNIAIEYQGQQHLEPIEYFGGKESFIKQQQMDKKKKKLCKQNNCKLIYVFENYIFDDLINQIDKFLQ